MSQVLTLSTRVADGVKPPLYLPPPKPDLRYARRPESGKLAVYLWRWRMWFEGTFALTVMETWERWLVISIFATLCALVLTFLIKFLPHNLLSMQKRAIYYLWGQATGLEGEEGLLKQLERLGLAGVGPNGK
ncbi:hypothetical protein CC1G_06495 [Coprinopsis cinerea okayama7|uniref:Uncharacterized protein n=1 Tax=Coprinopsis cinerea (strain Okayama-7 / 130 / ATCC MYA-4618 / FGSC 9003) TaxID=240176 RepID=A8NNB7_COPC7|nr:hypothetical protein CC1G_06495 [Coprinopsis cinerea okayama7\|eukprot:XP_001835092.1 hypothetical protein CC1G_06495 [Coprinopsis cinerea okayama7\